MKKWPKFVRFQKQNHQSPDFYYEFQDAARNVKGFRFFSYFHISTCDQIWLNYFGDDSHLSIITKLEKETVPPTVGPKNSYYLL
jgi:hypothetical protein